MNTTKTFSGMNRQLAAVALSSLLLTGCMTGKKAEEAAADAAAMDALSQTADAAGAPARTTATAQAGYIDPYVTTGAKRQKTAAATPSHMMAPLMAQAAPSNSATAQTGFPAAPQLPTPSLAETINQPTGVRAGSYSIFASAAAPPAAYAPTPNSAQGAPTPAAASGPFNAATGSMFSAHPSTQSTTCPTDGRGMPLSC